mgnify:CR=1 FL=1
MPTRVDIHQRRVVDIRIAIQPLRRRMQDACRPPRVKIARGDCRFVSLRACRGRVMTSCRPRAAGIAPSPPQERKRAASLRPSVEAGRVPGAVALSQRDSACAITCPCRPCRPCHPYRPCRPSPACLQPVRRPLHRWSASGQRSTLRFAVPNG